MAQPLTRPVRLLDDERGLHLYPLTQFLLREIGPEYLDWDSTALYLECGERWGQPGRLTWERIQAGRTMVGLDAFWIHMEIFENCGLALAGEIPVFSHFQPLDAESVAVIFYTAGLIKKHEYSDEVLSYALSCCLEDATWFLEDPLHILLPSLDRYDKDHRISRDHDAVRARLDRGGKASDPKDHIDVQVNNVISVRSTLASYKKILKQQSKDLGL